MSVFEVYVFSEDNLVDIGSQPISVRVDKEVNRIPYAELVYADGDYAAGNFPISDSPVFKPGNSIELKIGFAEESSGSAATLFKGLVILQEINVDPMSSTLRVVLKDAAVALAKNRNHRVFNNMTDTEIIKALLGYNQFGVDDIADTIPKYPEMIQHDCSDWDFIVTRAENNGMLVTVEAGKLSMQAIQQPGKSNLILKYGIDDLYSFNIAVNAESQFNEFSATSGVDLQNDMLDSNTEENVVSTQGNLTGSRRASIVKKMDQADFTMATTAKLNNQETKAYLTAIAKRNQLSFIKGTVSLSVDSDGHPDFASLKLLDTLELKNMGDRYNGKTVITGIGHRITPGNWLADIQFGLDDQWLLNNAGVNGLPALGLLPAVSGLQLGKVAAIYDDSNSTGDSQYTPLKIQVALPPLKQDAPYLVWAQLACPDAGNGRGYYFRPEIDDEVIVGFINDDPRQAVIVGSLYSSQKNPPPKRFGKPDEKNNARGIASKTGMVIGFDDEEKIVYIETPGNNSIKLDDNGKTIQVKDQHGNSIVMDESGITLNSAKDITLKADGNVTIKGTKVDIN